MWTDLLIWHSSESGASLAALFFSANVYTTIYKTYSGFHAHCSLPHLFELLVLPSVALILQLVVQKEYCVGKGNPSG